MFVLYNSICRVNEGAPSRFPSNSNRLRNNNNSTIGSQSNPHQNQNANNSDDVVTFDDGEDKIPISFVNNFPCVHPNKYWNPEEEQEKSSIPPLFPYRYSSSSMTKPKIKEKEGESEDERLGKIKFSNTKVVGRIFNENDSYCRNKLAKFPDEADVGPGHYSLKLANSSRPLLPQAGVCVKKQKLSITINGINIIPHGSNSSTIDDSSDRDSASLNSSTISIPSPLQLSVLSEISESSHHSQSQHYEEHHNHHHHHPHLPQYQVPRKRGHFDTDLKGGHEFVGPFGKKQKTQSSWRNFYYENESLSLEMPLNLSMFQGKGHQDEDKRVGSGTEKEVSSNSSPGQTKSPIKKKYICPDCNKEFSQLRNYRYHRSRHEGTTQFACTCPICGKSFNDKGYLSSHLKIHRNAKEYKCEYCTKSFNQRVAYNMHVRIHTGHKPHNCDQCPKAFSRKMLLKQHLRTHTGERPYSCAVCKKTFADRSNMLLHQRMHSGQRPYKCDLCEKTFTKNHHLKTHLNHHAGIRPYQCTKCQACFSQSSNMKTHYRKCTVIPVPLSMSSWPTFEPTQSAKGVTGQYSQVKGQYPHTLSSSSSSCQSSPSAFAFHRRRLTSDHQNNNNIEQITTRTITATTTTTTTTTTAIKSEEQCFPRLNPQFFSHCQTSVPASLSITPFSLPTMSIANRSNNFERLGSRGHDNNYQYDKQNNVSTISELMARGVIATNISMATKSLSPVPQRQSTTNNILSYECPPEQGQEQSQLHHHFEQKMVWIQRRRPGSGELPQMQIR